MSPWVFPIALNATTAEPIYLQITRAITSDIQRGRLRPGDPLPGSRTLAKSLGVHRNTILAAFQELQAEGWIQSERRTTRVAEALPPDAPETRPFMHAHVGFPLDIPSAPVWNRPSQGPAGTLRFGTGLPDLRLLPAEEIGRAYSRALRSRSLLGYGDPRGEGHLRTSLANLLSGVRGLAIKPDQLMIVSGSQMGLDLVTRILIRPGDRIAVEDPGYAPAWATLRAAGAELVPVPVDADGLRVDALAELLAKGPIRALYCTPHHQFPTTVTLAPARRMALLELAQRHGLAILEDDYDFEFTYDGSPVMPLASADLAGVVIYMGSLSKVIAPGLRLGFVAGPQPLVQALSQRRYTADRQGDHILERAVADLLEDGLLQRHVRKMRRIYQSRRDTLSAALERHLAGAVSFDVPSGGMSVWLYTDPAIDVEAWAKRAEQQGVAFATGRAFDFEGRPRSNVRLGFSALNEEELQRAVQRMKVAL